MPALRECRDDIPVIANALLERVGEDARLTPEAVAELQRHDFPGNIRELENILERATALSGASEVAPEDLRLRVAALEEAPAGARSGTLDAPLPEYLDRVEREAILEALAKTGFNRTAAAKLLGVTFRTLRYRMQRLGIHEPPEQDGR